MPVGKPREGPAPHNNAPKNAAGRSNLASALNDKGDWHGATLEYQEAIRLDPTFAPPHNGLGVTFYFGGTSLLIVVGVAMDTVTVTEPFIRSGKLRLVASAYGKRVPSFPDTPTVAEQGFPNIDFAAWLGVVVTRGAPQARIDQLGDAIGKIVQAQNMEDKLRTLGCIPHSLGPHDFAAFLDKEDVRWSNIVKQAGVTVE